MKRKIQLLLVLFMNIIASNVSVQLYITNFHLRTLAILVLAISACQQPAASEQSNKPAPSIEILESIEVDSVVADFPVGFKFVLSGEWQFISYYNKHRELTVASRKVSEKKWNYQILPTKVGWDSHNRITMALDRDHCLHLSGNMHNDTLIYFKTERPNDSATFKRLFPIVSAQDERRCTYPSFIKNAEGALIFSYRKGGSGNGVTISNIYDEKIKSFKRLTDKPLFDGLGLMSAYARGPVLGPDSLFHVHWLWRDTPGCETNHDLSYARSSDLVHWETIDGQKTELPITPKSVQFTVDPIPPLGGAINGGTSFFFDSDKKPLIAYMKYGPTGNSQIFLATIRDQKWVANQVSDWNYRWAFSGPGSITFEIRLQGGELTPDGTISIAYQHIKRGSGELVVDPNTLSLIADRPRVNVQNSWYPAELLTPNSNIDSASVRWLKMKASPERPNEYYALRWETMGKRRFYKPRENPVKPSVMKLYKLVRDE